MNSLESAILTSPISKEEECAKFIIDDISTPFLMNDITCVGWDYSFTAWIRSEAEGSVVVNGTTFSTSTDWERRLLQFTATDTTLVMLFSTPGTYYIYHPQLEIGNTATDWTPAPEDVDEDIDEVNNSLMEVIYEQHTKIIAESEQIILAALASYVTTGDHEAFKSTVETQLSVMAGEISMNFTTTTEQIQSVDSDLQTKFEEVYKHIQFDENGITISSGENAIKLTLDNDMIYFWTNDRDKPFGKWDGVDFHTGNIVVEVNERAQFGNFAFIPRSDGSLQFLKVGE